MKFVVVNHRTPLDPSTCLECSRPLGRGYVRDVSTHRHYCDHDCYVRYEAKIWSFPFMASVAPLLAATRALPLPTTPDLELMTSIAAATCWCSIAFAKTALHVSELMAEEAFDI